VTPTQRGWQTVFGTVGVCLVLWLVLLVIGWATQPKGRPPVRDERQPVIESDRYDLVQEMRKHEAEEERHRQQGPPVYRCWYDEGLREVECIPQ